MPDPALERPTDPLTRRFGPLGLGGELAPADSAELLRQDIEVVALPPIIPSSVRGQFDKVCDLYGDGLFRYSYFTEAARRSYGVIESALKVRFLEHYAEGVPIVVAGVNDLVQATAWREIDMLFGRPAKPKQKLFGHSDFNGSLHALLRWARDERYFYGQRNQGLETSIVAMRNELAHTEHDIVEMPPSAFRAIRTASELVCRLWETDPSNGIHYPPPAVRVPHLFGRGDDEFEVAIFGPEAIAESDKARYADLTWHAVLADPSDRRLPDWQPGFEITSSPIAMLWGPGNGSDLNGAVQRHSSSWLPDTARLLDRIFFVRLLNGTVDLPRTAAQMKALRNRDDRERWIVLLADDPSDALEHCRAVAAGICHGQCSCAVRVIRNQVKPDRVDAFIAGEMKDLSVPRQRPDLT